jgi:ribosomal protein S8E
VELQVTCDVDRIIAGLDYDSFELLPGTVNPRPGMRYIEDIYDPTDSVDPTEESLDFVEDTAIEEAPSMYFLSSPTPYWSPFLMDHRLEGKKKKKNKKKRNKNRQRQFQLQLQLEQDVSPPTTPDSSDRSTDSSPVHSPVKSPPKVELSPEKKAKKKRNKQRRRGSGRARRLNSQNYPSYEAMDLMSVHLNGMNLSPSHGTGVYSPKPEPYPLRHSPHPQHPHQQPIGPTYSLGGGGGPMFTRGTPLWIPHPVIYGQC